uniref:RmlD-like substrate binding domain-containing protein n=1 Tax=viral metagenome TaxID=1070528 RepID=A0A6C0J586_9ZZZZ
MKVYIIGYNGWIGNKMQDVFLNNNIKYINSLYRAEDKNIYEDILKYDITHVFCCSGRTHGKLDDTYYNTIDYLEDIRTTSQNINDNLYVPVSLALFCEKNKIHFTYIGTGCIFNYDDKHTIDNNVGFTEDDEPNFFGSQYSIVKGVTDKLMKNTSALTLRIRMPLSSDLNDRNFISKITKYDKICSIKNSMTSLDDMLPICLEMMKNNERGVFNFTNPGSISHNEILDLYKYIIDPNFTWVNFDINEQDKVLKSKRSNNYLDTSKLESKYKVKNIKNATIDILYKMKESII